MKVFILIVFSIATFRTIVPLGNKEEFTLANIIFASAHIVALWHLFSLLVTFK
jgi:hypothetical protein